MLAFMQNWFAPGANPVGVDFGTDCLRLAQVEAVDGEYRLVAAASAEVPSHVRNDPAGRMTFFSQTLRELLAQGNFRGRKAVLALPAASMYIQHLRLPKMDEESLRKALPWEARGKLPMDPSQALLRHLLAGEVYQDQEQKSEVILMAARRDLVEQLLAAAAKARLEVVGMTVEPRALLDCFSHVYRRKNEQESTTCFVDIGCNGTRAMIAYNGQVLFARSIPIGGEHFNKAVASGLSISLEDAKLLRIRVAGQMADEPREKSVRSVPAVTRVPSPAAQPAAEEADVENSFALLGAAMRASKANSAEAVATTEKPRLSQTSQVPAKPVELKKAETAEKRPVSATGAASADESEAHRQEIEQASSAPLARLVEELALCRRYHEATFPNRPVDRLVFVGGEARHRWLCQSVARELGIAAQVGDPMARISRAGSVGMECGMDRRLPQPAWAIAIGLSMGSPQQTAAAQKTASSASE